MKNQFQYFGNNIHILPKNMATNYLVSRYNIIYIQQMKYNKNGLLVVYSRNNKEESDKDFNLNENDIIQTQNTGLNLFIKINLFEFSSRMYQNIRREFFFFKQYLCVVYGLQFRFLDQNKTNWYTAKLVKLFVRHNSFLIKITDCSLFIKPILKDLKHVLNGPIVSVVNFISLSKLRNNLHTNLSMLFQSSVLIFETFILQIDEDGEEVLTKIKETDIFRREKPGTISFFKKKIIHDEDENFSEFRFLKRKTRSFLKIIALLILPFIIYRTNQQTSGKLSLPKLAYIMFNANEGTMQYSHKNEWNDFLGYKLSTKNIQENITKKHINKLMQSNESDRARIMKLWNAKTSNFEGFSNLYSEGKILSNIDALLFGQRKMNRAISLQRSSYIDLYFKKKIYQNINEHNISQHLIKYALFLIKPRDIMWNKTISINNIDDISVLKNNEIITNTDLLSYTKVLNLVNKFRNFIPNRFKHYLEIENLDLSYTKQLLLLKQINKELNNNNIISSIKELFYQKRQTSIHSITSTNALLEANIPDISNNLNLLPTQTSLKVIYINELISLIHTLLKNYIQNTINDILYCFNLSLGSSKISFQDGNIELNYLNNVVNGNDKELYSKELKFDSNLMFIQPNINNEIIFDFDKQNDFQYVKLLVPHLDLTSQRNLVSNFDNKGIKKDLFIPLLKYIDTLYLGLSNDWNNSSIYDTDTEIKNIILLLYPSFFENNYTIYNCTQLWHNFRNINRIFFQEIKQNISLILSKEQKQTYMTCRQYNKKIKYFDSKNTRLSDNQYQNHNNCFLKKSEFFSVQFVSSLNFNQLSQRSNILKKFENQIDLNQHDSLNVKNLWYSLTNIFKNYVQLNSLLKLHNNLHIYQEDVINQFNVKELSHSRDNASQYSILTIYIYNQIEIIKQYIPWLFTSEWWSFVKHANKKIWLILLQDIYDCVYSNTLPITRYIRNKSHLIPHEMYQNIIDNNNIDISHKLEGVNLFVEKQLQKAFYNFPLSIWESGGVSSFRINIWSYVGSIVSLSSLYWFSFLLGGSSFVLWVMFERIRDLTDLSWNTELDILLLANLRKNKNPNIGKQRLKKRDKLQEQYYLSLGKWSIWFRLVYSRYIGSKIQTIWLYNTRNPDIYRGQRDLASQLLVGETSLLGLTLYNLDAKLRHDLGYQSIQQEGLNYLKQLTTARYKWYTDSKENFLNNQRFIPFAFYKNHSASEELWELNDLGIVREKSLPISLQLSELYSKGILLIGPPDTGKSFLVKSLARDADLPLIHIAIDSLTDVLEFEGEMLEANNSLYFLRESIIKFKAITHLLNKIGSCVIWIPNIEAVHNLWNYKSPVKELCTLLVLRYLLVTIKAILDNNKHILVFASCENTNSLDPGFVSPQHFSRFVNFRLPNHSQRPQIFARILKHKGVEIKSQKRWDAAFSNSTMGFTLRELSVLANEAFRFSIQEKRKFLSIDDLRLVIYRALRANDAAHVETSFQQQERIQYKIGRAIVQNTLLKSNSMLPLSVRYELWKPRFYYLSKAYLQSTNSQPTITQLEMVPYILNCLAGSAARDAWLLLNKRGLKEDSYYLNTEIEHDLTLAVNLFETLFKEFACLDIYEKPNENSIFLPQFKRMNTLVFLDQGNDVTKQALEEYQSQFNFSIVKKNTSVDLINHLEDILTNIDWCSRTERLSLSRNVFFDLLKRVDEPLSLFSSVRFYGNTSLNPMLFEKERPHSGHYHISWDVMKLQFPKDLDYTFYGMLAKQRITTMALPIHSDQLMEYEPAETNIFSFWGRPICNPAATFFRNLVFRQRKLFADEELLSILYLMHKAQQRPSFMFTKTRRKERWTPDIYLENVSMETRLKRMAQNQHIFSRFKSLAEANATFRRPLGETPKNSEIPFIKKTIASNRFSRFSFTEDIFYQQNILKEQNAKTEELLTYGTILESYHYLLNFFIRKQHILKSITSMLIEKGLLYEEDIQNSID